MIKVGEHITLDIIGTTGEYEPSFFEGLVHKIAEKAKVNTIPGFNLGPVPGTPTFGT